MTTRSFHWRSIVPSKQALGILGYSALAGITVEHARARAAGAWDANDRDAYVAWRSVEAVLTHGEDI